MHLLTTETSVKILHAMTIVIMFSCGKEIRIVLVGAAARQFDARTVLDEGRAEPKVAIFVGAFVRKYLGDNALYGSVTLSWYINKDIPHINEFRASISTNPVFVAQAPMPAHFHLRQQPDGTIPHETLDSLICYDLFANQDTRLSCTVKIKRLTPSERWWQARCRLCSSIAYFSGPPTLLSPVYFCNRDD